MSQHRIYKAVFVICLLSVFCSAAVLAYTAYAKEASVRLDRHSVKMGKRIAFHNVRGDETFRSNKPLVAYVSSGGVITGKKPGKAVITVWRGSRKIKSVRIRVKKAKRKPNLAVCLDELGRSAVHVTERADGPAFALDVKNLSRSYKIKKLKISYNVQVRDLTEPPVNTPDATPVGTPDATPVGTPDVTPVGTPDATPVDTPDTTPVDTPDTTPVDTPDTTPVGTPDVPPAITPIITMPPAGSAVPSSSASAAAVTQGAEDFLPDRLENAPAGARKLARKMEGIREYTVTFTAKNLDKRQGRTLYASVGDGFPKGGEIVGCEEVFVRVSAQKSFAQEEQDTYTWGYNTRDTKAPVFRGFVRRNSFHNMDVYMVMYQDSDWSFRKYVSAWDQRDGRVQFKVDTSRVNKNRKGTYSVWFEAQDAAGNKARTWAKIQVRQLTGVDAYADTILKRITRKGWSDVRKCKAIYAYVKGHMSYMDYDGGKSWESSSLRAIRYNNGNCYAYYSLSRLLMTRAGIPNMMITRYPAREHHHHWWNLVYVQNGWYHFDTVSRRTGGRFCLLTEAQIRSYSRVDSYAFQFPSNAYPKRATKVICRGPF